MKFHLGLTSLLLLSCALLTTAHGQTALQFYNRGVAKQKAGDAAGAMADYNSAIKLAPSSPDPYTNRGLIRQDAGDVDGAMLDYRRAISLNPKDSGAYNNLGLAWRLKGELDKALTALNRAVELDPKSANAFNSRGSCRSDMKDIEGAMADYDRAIKLDPDLADAYFNRSGVKLHNGDIDGTISDSTRAIELNPRHAAAFNSRGLARQIKGEREDALGDFNRAIELDPGLDAAYFNRGNAYSVERNWTKALADYSRRESSEGDPDYPRFFVWITRARLGEQVEADAELAAYVKKRWKGDLETWSARIGALLTDTMSEADFLASAASSDATTDRGQHCEAWFYAGMKRLLAGDKITADGYFSKCVATGEKPFAEYMLAEGELRTPGPMVVTVDPKTPAAKAKPKPKISPLGVPIKPPNILFCFADDWGRYASCYEGLDGRATLNDVVQTPNIDRIADRGVVFKNAFVGSPSCTPCRSALLSGRYFFNTGRGAILNGAEWDPEIPSWPLLLRDSGYHLGKMYKVWSPGTPADAPIGGQKYAYQDAGGLVNKFSHNVTQMVSEGATVNAAKRKVLDQVRENFTAFLDANNDGKPWTFFFGPTNTHRTWVKGSGKALWGIEPDSLKGKLPAFLPDVPEVREDVADYLGEVQAWDASCGAIFQILEARGQMENTQVFISGDHGMGGMPRGKCNLYDFGTNVALIAAGPGIVGGKKKSPGVKKKLIPCQRVVEDFVWLPDLAATFLETAGLDMPKGMSARSLWPTLLSEEGGLVDDSRTWVVTGRERHVAGAREGNLPYPHRAIRTKDFLYIKNFAPERWPMGSPKQVTDTSEPSASELENSTYAAYADMDASPTKAYFVAHRHDSDMKNLYNLAFAVRPGDELYDLRSDPDQMMNVAADPAFAEAKKKMEKQLMSVLKKERDPRVSDHVTFEESPFTDAAQDAAKKETKQKARAKQGQ